MQWTRPSHTFSFWLSPPKTATTTLQEGFKQVKNQLLSGDNIYYCAGGNVCGKIAHLISSCGLKPNYTESLECWDQTRRTLNGLPRPKNDTHVLLSSEPMSIGNGWQHHLKRHAPIDWLSVKEQLGKDWRVVIIVGYRRYVDWLPSSDQQIWRWTPSKPRMNKWPDKGGRVFTPLLPTRWKKAVKPGAYTYTHTSLLLEGINGTLPVVLFNMHDLRDLDLSNLAINNNSTLLSHRKVSLLSRFLCKNLKEAGIETNSTCIHSLRTDIATTGHKVANPSQTLFYDALGVAAWKKQLVSSNMRRHTVALSIERFHTEQLNQTHHDLPVTCPSKNEYEEFLEFSITTEATTVPEFSNTAMGRQSHIESFWKSVAKQKYCWIDTDKILEREEWKQFFQTNFA